MFQVIKKLSLIVLASFILVGCASVGFVKNDDLTGRTYVQGSNFSLYNGPQISAVIRFVYDTNADFVTAQVSRSSYGGWMDPESFTVKDGETYKLSSVIKTIGSCETKSRCTTSETGSFELSIKDFQKFSNADTSVRLSGRSTYVDGIIPSVRVQEFIAFVKESFPDANLFD